ncbi:hypothetical protein BaRGS_00020311 [Batillaria attramentaria]|uniref:Uncharacterized protein n=1 Tax=Batillaria attramentaria TaxID=370345 RepID=A0ABD0KNM2_9CAEN
MEAALRRCKLDRSSPPVPVPKTEGACIAASSFVASRLIRGRFRSQLRPGRECVTGQPLHMPPCHVQPGCTPSTFHVVVDMVGHSSFAPKVSSHTTRTSCVCGTPALQTEDVLPAPRDRNSLTGPCSVPPRLVGFDRRLTEARNGDINGFHTMSLGRARSKCRSRRLVLLPALTGAGLTQETEPI